MKKLENYFNYQYITLVLLIAAILLVNLAVLPVRLPHIDEGMGIRASEFVLDGSWHYWSKNGHGPTLFYLGSIVRQLFGVNFSVFRFLTELCLLITLFLLWRLYRKRLNFSATMVLLFGLGLSPGMIFFGAYYIHEPLFILLTGLTLFAIERWLTLNKSFFLGLAVICAGLMYMTKETALITYMAWFLAGMIVLIRYKKWQYARSVWHWRPVLMALAILIGVYLFFFGLSVDLLKAPAFWLLERGVSIHLQPWYYFPGLLAVHEFFLIVLALFVTVFITRNKLWDARLTFLWWWFVIITAIYSFIPYKTPWLVINMILPLSVFVALGWAIAWRQLSSQTVKIGLGILAVILAVLSLSRLQIDNFNQPNVVTKFGYPYLQSGEDFRQLYSRLEDLNQQQLVKTGQPVTIQIIGFGDELLHVLTEKYNRIYPPFKPGLPAYINYQQDYQVLEDILGTDAKRYERFNYQYFAPGPAIDLFIRKDLL